MQFLFVIDPLDSLKAYKDSSITMMREAQHRGHAVWVCEQTAIAADAGEISAQEIGRAHV